MAKLGVVGPRSASCAPAQIAVVLGEATFVSCEVTVVSYEASVASCEAAVVSHIAAVHSLRADGAFRFARVP